MIKLFVDQLVLNEAQYNPIFTENLYLWTNFVHNHEWEKRPFDKPILDLLSYAVEGRVSRLMVSVPPQHGKSSFITEAFLSYIMVHCPNENIILSSYTQDLATELGGNIKDIINYYGQYTPKKPRIRQDTKAKNKFRFERPYNGRLLARGSGGGITGFEANIFIIDDPIKSFEDAMSLTVQDKVGYWYNATVQMRLRKRKKGKLPPILILVAQRLHERDLHGQIMENEPYIEAKEALTLLKNGETIPPDTWVKLNLSGICDDPENDILGRKKGEVLWENHRDYDNLMALKRSVGSYIFETQIQGNPQKLNNYIFTHDMFYDEHDNIKCITPYEDFMKELPCGRFWDLASQSNKKEVDMKTGDYYCGSLCCKDEDTDILYVLGMERDKRKAIDVLNLVKGVLMADGEEVYTDIEQEGASQSLLFITELQEQYPNYDINYHKPTVKKEVRAIELKRLAEFGLLKFVELPNADNQWIYDAVHELISFDGLESNARRGKHDDIVDSLSMAATHFKLNHDTSIGGLFEL